MAIHDRPQRGVKGLAAVSRVIGGHGLPRSVRAFDLACGAGGWDRRWQQWGEHLCVTTAADCTKSS
jgi:hypothetical protein